MTNAKIFKSFRFTLFLSVFMLFLLFFAHQHVLNGKASKSIGFATSEEPDVDGIWKLLGGEVRKIKLERYESILIDFKCYKKIRDGLRCEVPLKIASTSLSNQSSEKTQLEYRIEDKEEKDYLIWTKQGEKEKRLIPKIDTVQARIPIGNNEDEFIELNMPMDIELFLRQFRDSRFIPSKALKMQREPTKQRIRLKTASSILNKVRRKVELFARKHQKPMTVFIVGGTLLGWYRENSIIPHTGDIDFAMKKDDLYHPYKFIDHIESTFPMRDRIGFVNESLEFRFRVHGVPTDLFIMYNDENQTYLPGVDFYKHQQLRWYLPKMDEFCAGDLLDSLVYVPCNVEEVLEADYGKYWQKDHPTSKYHYAEAGQVRRGKKLFGDAWKDYVKRPKSNVIGRPVMKAKQ